MLVGWSCFVEDSPLKIFTSFRVIWCYKGIYDDALVATVTFDDALEKEEKIDCENDDELLPSLNVQLQVPS